MPRKLTKKEFIKRCNNVHGEGRYDYKDFDYKNSKTKVKIWCNKVKQHKNKKSIQFEKTPQNHLYGKQGCKECSWFEYGNKKRIKTTEQVIKEFKNIHGDKYDYRKLLEQGYKNPKIKFPIYCKKHKEWHNTNYDRHGRYENKLICCCSTRPLTNEIIDKKLIEQKRNHLIYRISNIIDIKTDINWGCYICNWIWEASPSNVIHGKTGCPKCKLSKGSLEITNHLDEFNIFYKLEKRFSDCKNVKTLPFDFYLPDYNLVIEFQGRQHYKPDFYILKYGKERGIKKFNDLQKNDLIKNDWSKISTKPKLFIITFKDFEKGLIKEKLVKKLKLKNL